MRNQFDMGLWLTCVTTFAELKATPLPNPHSTASKKFRLIFKEGVVILRPLQFGQTSFTFTAQVDVGELMKDTAVGTPSKLGRFTAATANKRNKSNSAKKVVVGSETGKGNEFFCKLAGFFYERFKKEDVIDERRKADFIENKIPNAPPLTEDEQKMIKESMELFEDVASKAKRISGTVNQSVEKYLHRAEGGSEAAVGMTVAIMDVTAVTLFTDLWLRDTYAQRSVCINRRHHRHYAILTRERQSECATRYPRRRTKYEKVAVRQVWNDLDGTRSMQYTNSVSLPGGFHDRLFETWLTWVEKVEVDGRRTYIIAFCPLKKYGGRRHEVDGTEKLQEATTRGVYIVKELTKHTCEWTWVQQVTLKISLPAKMLDIVTKQQMSWADELQEKFRRNGKEVDQEGVAALL